MVTLHVTADAVVWQGDASEDASLQAGHVHRRGPARDGPADAVDAHPRDTTRRKHVHESTRSRNDVHLLRLQVR